MADHAALEAAWLRTATICVTRDLASFACSEGCSTSFGVVAGICEVACRAADVTYVVLIETEATARRAATVAAFYFCADWSWDRALKRGRGSGN